MSWALGGDWLAVAGLTCLTIGTGAQAWASLAEFNSLRKEISSHAGQLSDLVQFGIEDEIPGCGTGFPGRLISAIYIVVTFPGFLKKLRRQGGEAAVQLRRFFRLAEVWTLLMIGSALVLAAAVIQLVLALQ